MMLARCRASVRSVTGHVGGGDVHLMRSYPIASATSGCRLISIHHFRGKGRHTGIEDGGRYAYLWTFREAKVIRFRTYRDPAEALEAARLRE